MNYIIAITGSGHDQAAALTQAQPVSARVDNNEDHKMILYI